MSYSVEKKARPVCRRQSTGEYVNEGLGPSISAVVNTEYRNNTSTRVRGEAVNLSVPHQYDTVESDCGIESRPLSHHICNDVTTFQSTTSNVSPSALQLNSAYGIELPSDPHSRRSKNREPIYHNTCRRTVDNV